MKAWKQSFQEYVGGKDNPNSHEQKLFERAQKYIHCLTWIPGIEMIAICNSLSMYATHPDSDIDLFIITEKHRIWLVRILVTLTFTLLGVRRTGKEIPGNFCLSFFITTEAIHLEKIAIQNDIYLYYWIYYLLPIWEKKGIYDRFIRENSWVEIDSEQVKRNTQYLRESPKSKNTKNILLDTIDDFFRYLFEKKTRQKNIQLGNPWGVTITENMLKFHPKDRRKEITNDFFEKK